MITITDRTAMTRTGLTGSQPRPPAGPIGATFDAPLQDRPRQDIHSYVGVTRS